jgi:hypothetical protein
MTNSQTVPSADPKVNDTPTGRGADRLEAGVQALTVPEPMAEAESLLLKIGVALPLVGLVVVMVGWWQTSGTAIVAEQVPSLISGGLLGLGLVIIGLGLFVRYSLTRMFRFWLARLMVEQQAQTDRVVAALDGIETAIREGRVGK